MFTLDTFVLVKCTYFIVWMSDGHRGYGLHLLFTTSSVTTTRGHSAKIEKHRCQLDLRRHFFSQRVINK